MEMVAASKIKRAEERIANSRPYSQKMLELMANLAQRAGAIEHPLLQVREPQEKIAILALTADRGLCGAFNTNVVRQTENLFGEIRSEGKEGRLIVVGRKGVNYFRYIGYPLFRSIVGISDNPTFADAQEITQELIDLYTRQEIDKAIIIFNHFKSLAEQKVVEQTILPIGEEVEKKGAPERVGEYLFEPSPAILFLDLLPTYLEVFIYRALIESAASEQAARRIAMKAATDNAQEMINNLRLSYNKARQAQITQEIAEIVGTTEALK